PGPFKPLLEALQRLQAAAGTDVPMRLRTALVTARSAPAHERAVRTLMDWNIAVDEAMFLGGLDKGAFLKAFEPDFYFDDQRAHALDELLDEIGVIAGAALPVQEAERARRRQRLGVGPHRGQRVEGIGDRRDRAVEPDLLAFEPARVTAAVLPFVVQQGKLRQ